MIIPGRIPLSNFAQLEPEILFSLMQKPRLSFPDWKPVFIDWLHVGKDVTSEGFTLGKCYGAACILLEEKLAGGKPTVMPFFFHDEVKYRYLFELYISSRGHYYLAQGASPWLSLLHVSDKAEAPSSNPLQFKVSTND